MSNVLPFPPRNKGRVRKTRSVFSMGRIAFTQFDEGYSIPANVVDMRCAVPEPIVPDDRLTLRLALAVFAVLSEDQKGRIIDSARMYGRHKDDWEGVECRALYRLLTGAPC